MVEAEVIDLNTCSHPLKIHTLINLLIFFILFATTPNVKGELETASSENDRETCLKSNDTPAISACERLLQKKPDNLPILIRTSDLFGQRKDYDTALVFIQRAAQQAPDSEKVQHRVKKLISYQKEKQWADARKNNQIAPKTLITSTTFKRNRVKCIRLKGTKALEACNKAIQEKEDDHELYKARGKIFEQFGRREEAANDYKLWVKWNPSNPLNNRKTKQVELVKIKPQKKKRKNTITTPAPALEQPIVQLAYAPDSVISNQPKRTKFAQSQQPPKTLTKKLATLKELLDSSLISEAEYEKHRAALLSSIVAVPKKENKEFNTSFNPKLLGNYHALVIGEQNYQFLPKLKTATKDAEDVSSLLAKRYGFRVTTLLDASRREILLALYDYRLKLTKNDNLLIYYAGHGWLDEKEDAGYWIPVEAVEGNRVDWISMATLTSSVRALEAKHVLIVADSCFSGKLARGIFGQDKSANYLVRIAQKRTRVVLTSGGLEPVLDGGGKGGHSVFAATFLQVLEENNELMDGSTLFTRVRRPVMLKAQQVPEYSDIRMAGHEGGDFIFMPVINNPGHNF